MCYFMREKLKSFLLEKLKGNDEDLDLVISKFNNLEVKKNEVILKEGDICDYCYFIVEGCIQVFIYDINGNESTRDFLLENNFVSELNSFNNFVPSKEYLRAIENTKLLKINRKDFQDLLNSIPNFSNIYRQILEVTYSSSIYRINTLISMSASERVRWLIKNNNKLVTRLSNKQIASYLGISPETLSRIIGKF